MFLPLTLLAICWLAVPVHGTIEEVEVTPSNTNALELGELSFMQFVLLALIFLKLVALYTVGVLPIEINLGAAIQNFTNKRGFIEKEAEITTYFMDCPLQFVCDLDAWANRDHDSFSERLIASWFRNSNQTWHHENAGVFGGGGTCKEMYPCPFDVQEVVGIRIPGSNALTEPNNNKDDSYSFF